VSSLRDELADALLNRGAKRLAKGIIEFRCPRHGDGKPSAWLGDHRWGCHACGFEEPLETLAAELGIRVPSKGYTVEEYGTEKSLNLKLLREAGVETRDSERGGTVVVIPYRDEEGRLLRNRFRGPRGAMFWDGQRRPTYIYGRDRLAQADPSQPVLIVEGESDCHAAWQHDVLALGVPGANMWKKVSDHRHVLGLLRGREVFIWQEPGEAGAEFVKSITRDLPHARIILPDGVKDLADLHRAKGDGFAEALKILIDKARPLGTTAPTVHFDVAFGETLKRLAIDAKSPVQAVPTPLRSWNSVCRDEGGGKGLAPGWHVIIAGSTGHGKSLLALNLADAAIRHGERVAYVSLEMSQRQLLTRFLALHSGIPIRRLEPGEDLSEADLHSAQLRLTETCERTGGRLFVNRTPIHKLQDIEAAIRRQHEDQGCRVIIVDYLQLAWLGSAKSLFENIQEVSHRVRQLAAGLGVVSVGLSQLNRETSKQPERPKPHGLMGGSPLENDADQVVLLDHSNYERSLNEATTQILIAKNRHGPLTEIPVRWDYRALQIRETNESDVRRVS
jgi:KaiC/GvpD/RAD55 family RecA-like ATPase